MAQRWQQKATKAKEKIDANPIRLLSAFLPFYL